MHSCPFCDFLCDCDLDDTWGLPVPDDCPHVCSEDDFDPDVGISQLGFKYLKETGEYLDERIDDIESDWEDYEEFMDFEEEES